VQVYLSGTSLLAAGQSSELQTLFVCLFCLFWGGGGSEETEEIPVGAAGGFFSDGFIFGVLTTPYTPYVVCWSSPLDRPTHLTTKSVYLSSLRETVRLCSGMQSVYLAPAAHHHSVQWRNRRPGRSRLQHN
jgi:hypothetical protein